MPDFASVTCLPHNLLLCALFVVYESRTGTGILWTPILPPLPGPLKTKQALAVGNPGKQSWRLIHGRAGLGNWAVSPPSSSNFVSTCRGVLAKTPFSSLFTSDHYPGTFSVLLYSVLAPASFDAAFIKSGRQPTAG
ncbi:hypothetical protein LMH87_000091 [Akanthomyces muscarius]|uniref:Secreted protein n=1 Tax=Akanthomyces muscarius TaxID=2231603 RepID=A0A9W8QGM2_AKAMU|nr:hypothetical protein LMH87_000091 [Akanthomyces muscarius]KAJ4154815.1 hypothetical protein LMH87_000091 [Akanthomyces muscarius]